MKLNYLKKYFILFQVLNLFLITCLFSQIDLTRNTSGYSSQYLKVFLKENNEISNVKDSILQPRKESIFHPAIPEIFVGLTGGILIALPGGIISHLIFANKSGGHPGDIFPLIIGAYCGYIIGTSLGVYKVSHDYNSETSYWGTLSFGILGGGVGVGTAFIFKNWFGGILVPILPLLSEILYVNITYKQQYTLIRDKYNYHCLNLPSNFHQDFYNSTMLYKMEVLRINF